MRRKESGELPRSRMMCEIARHDDLDARRDPKEAPGRGTGNLPTHQYSRHFPTHQLSSPQKSHLFFETIDFFLRKLAAKVTGSARPGVIRETFQLFFRLIYKERGCEKKVVMTFDELP